MIPPIASRSVAGQTEAQGLEHARRQYASCGTKWLSYFYRRAAERRENPGFALRAIVS
jgi:proline dehydrogenase